MAAERAAARPATRTSYSGLWLVLVPLPAALRLALAWVPLRQAAEEPARAAWLALDPLIACHRWGRAGGLATLSLAEASCTVLGGALALAFVSAGARRARGVPA